MKTENKFRKYFAYAMIPGCLLISGTCVRAEEGWGTADWSGIEEDWLETEMPDSLQVTFVNFDEYWKKVAEVLLPYFSGDWELDSFQMKDKSAAQNLGDDGLTIETADCAMSMMMWGPEIVRGMDAEQEPDWEVIRDTADRIAEDLDEKLEIRIGEPELWIGSGTNYVNFSIMLDESLESGSRDYQVDEVSMTNVQTSLITLWFSGDEFYGAYLCKLPEQTEVISDGSAGVSPQECIDWMLLSYTDPVKAEVQCVKLVYVPESLNRDASVYRAVWEIRSQIKEQSGLSSEETLYFDRATGMQTGVLSRSSGVRTDWDEVLEKESADRTEEEPGSEEETGGKR